MSAGGEKSFVFFPLGNKRFAFHAEDVTELAKPDRVGADGDLPHVAIMPRRPRMSSEPVAQA